MANKNDKHKSNVFEAVLGGPWGLLDQKRHSGGGDTTHIYTGSFSNYKDYHAHDWETSDKNGNVNHGTVHGLQHDTWKDK